MFIVAQWLWQCQCTTASVAPTGTPTSAPTTPTTAPSAIPTTAPSWVTKPLPFPEIFDNCSIVTLEAKLLEVNGACCAHQVCAGPTHNFTCGVGCAAVLVPFFDDCQPALDTIFDVVAEDDKVDGNSSALRSVAHRNCMAASSRLLVISVAKMEADGCNLNMEGTVAKGAVQLASGTLTQAPTTTKPVCRDDSPGMKAVAGFTCDQMKATGACTMVERGLLPSLCTCSCPPKPGPHSRRTQGAEYAGSSACKMRTFDDKLDAFNGHCCNTTDKDDRCLAGVPVNCDYDCAKYLPTFYPACH